MESVTRRTGLRSTLNLENRNFVSRLLAAIGFLVRVCEKIWYIAILWFIIDAAYHTFVVNAKEKEVFPHLPCNLNVEPPDSLITELNASSAIACSVTNQVKQRPCLCCFEGECYRSIHEPFFSKKISRGKYIDEIDGKCYERTLPTAMTFRYMHLNGTEVDKVEEGERMVYITRVIEILEGTPRKGTEIECPEEVLQSQRAGWFSFF